MYNVFEKLKNLPVATLLDDISSHCLNGGIAIVNSETGSGKSLLVPLRIQQDTNEKIFVIQPRRFLAINAAENLSSLSETILGEDFGYLIGTSGSDEENRFHREKTKVTFTTYGYALMTKMIMEADHIVLDEIHEQSIDMSICKALLKYRYTNGIPPKHLILMSATLDVEAEIAYWNDVASTKIFSAGNGRKFECVKTHLPATHPAEAALSLIDEGYKGVLVFAPGVGEIQDVIEEIMNRMKPESYGTLVVESIHGSSEYDERKAALAPPPSGWSKILVGTNVIESGMNLPWVDAGVTTGEKKELHVRAGSGAVVLTTVPLAKSNVDQQAGRTNRFCDSKFIICGHKSYDDMSAAPTAEIERLPLTALYMHCQSIDIDPKTLQFMPQPKATKMREAEVKLIRLGFFDHQLKLTYNGKFAQNLPVGLETAAMLCHADELNILADVIPMAAVYEMGSLRKDHAYAHGFDRTSDVLDGVYAYAKAVETQSNPNYSRADKIAIMEHHNISMRRYIETSLIVKSLEQRFGIKANIGRYLSVAGHTEMEDAYLRQCILAASICNMGMQKPGLRSNVFQAANSYEPYQVSKGSAVANVYETKPAAAKLRVITPKNRSLPFTVAEHITQFSIEDISLFTQIRPEVFTVEDFGDAFHYLVHGVTFYIKAAKRTHREETPRYSREAAKVVVPLNESGTLGSGLSEAYARKKSAFK